MSYSFISALFTALLQKDINTNTDKMISSKFETGGFVMVKKKKKMHFIILAKHKQFKCNHKILSVINNSKWTISPS